MVRPEDMGEALSRYLVCEPRCMSACARVRVHFCMVHFGVQFLLANVREMFDARRPARKRSQWSFGPVQCPVRLWARNVSWGYQSHWGGGSSASLVVLRVVVFACWRVGAIRFTAWGSEGYHQQTSCLYMIFGKRVGSTSCPLCVNYQPTPTLSRRCFFFFFFFFWS